MIEPNMCYDVFKGGNSVDCCTLNYIVYRKQIYNAAVLRLTNRQTIRCRAVH